MMDGISDQKKDHHKCKNDQEEVTTQQFPSVESKLSWSKLGTTCANGSVSTIKPLFITKNGMRMIYKPTPTHAYKFHWLFPLHVSEACLQELHVSLCGELNQNDTRFGCDHLANLV